MDGNYSEDTTVRRRRRIGRSVREKTPDPNHRRYLSEGDNHLVDMVDTTSEDTGAQVICMQIRPPRTMSAHESKILRRRDKTFASAASRSHSQPRQAEKLSSPQASQIIHTVKRSLSTPRNKDHESSDGEMLARERTLSPETKYPAQTLANENLSRLEQNMRRFDQERKRFEVEKRLFEREKRDHILKHRQLYDSEERKRLLQNYRKLSDRFHLPSDSEERQERNLAPRRINNKATARYEESSTQFSSSEAETEEVNKQYKNLGKQLSPARKHNRSITSSSIRGPPHPPPTRRAVSRNNSLSPIRPQRRSKTPDITADQRAPFNTTENQTEKMNTLRQRQATNRKDSWTASECEIVRPERKRKQSLGKSDKLDGTILSYKEVPTTNIAIEKVQNDAKSQKSKETILQRLIAYWAKSGVSDESVKINEKSETKSNVATKIIFKTTAFTTVRVEWQQMKADYPTEWKELKRLQKKCSSHVILLVLLIGFGGLMFRYTEGSAENIYKCEVRKVKRDFIDHLWTKSHNMREDDWKSLARQKLRKFEEELHNMGELGIRYFPGQKSWNFVNCILYCWTVITTIGYGHITPKTTLGQALTIIYAIIGIPMFLILLADFGKLFTRAIKFVWGYVRRLYYRGTCRRIRKQQHVQDAMTGFTAVYDMAIRRPSHFLGMSAEADVESQAGKSHPETPTSPYPDTIVVDDEFNLPISLASLLLVAYILIGAFVYTLWEDWTYFEAFYFVFISMSTIGFGDLVPNHPIFMMCSILYMILGLALTSMFINVVQIKLSDTFRQASAKIGATIGLGLGSERGDDISQPKTPSDLASVHNARLNKIIEMESDTPRSTQSILKTSHPNSHAELEEIINDHENAAVPPLLPKGEDAMEGTESVENKKKRRFFSSK